MRGYTTNYVNLIADNLRDRYDNGFPIIKELIQNADDARATTLIFARHPGFPETSHPLLKGPGLWFFNDGEFKDSDARALRSFGINTKAGDAAAIGKFGLGMKSVFHLCEALFYLAWDGNRRHREGLTPWKQDDQNLHPDWEDISDEDWSGLEKLGSELAGNSGRTWFLLWIPLRRRDQLREKNGQEMGAIIPRFPGDDARELAFLDQEGLPHDLAEMLPMLRHLEQIEHREDAGFVMRLRAEQRLLGEGNVSESAGEVSNGGERLLCFAGKRYVDHDSADLFTQIKGRREWPRSRYRDELGQERETEDKTSPEAAVVFCNGVAANRPSNLHWAVFLPLEEGGERLGLNVGNTRHSLILHGQFFVDAGRKKIHGIDVLHEEPEPLNDGHCDDALLRLTWNKHLAQQILMPLVIPAFEHYMASSRLSDQDCKALTGGIADSRWFHNFRSHVCRSDGWVRLLDSKENPAWRKVRGEDRDRLRPMPSPPKSASDRPWQVFPRLASLGLSPFDGDAGYLTDHACQWKEAELVELLGEVAGLFSEGSHMDYLESFLGPAHGVKPYLNTEAIQHSLARLFRKGFRAVNPERRRQQAEKSRRLIGFIQPENRLALAADLLESVLRCLWEVEAPILLVPKGLDPDPSGKAVPQEETLRDWLRVMDRLLTEGAEDGQKAMLEAVQGLLKTLEEKDRGRFLRIHEDLRVIAVRDARDGHDRARSFGQIRALREAGTLFGFAQGLGKAALGLTPLLAGVLPEAKVCLVRAGDFRTLFSDDDRLPVADQGQACLEAIARDGSGRLGGLSERLKLLGAANDPGTSKDARRGLRYLLHGSPEHKTDDQTTLWIRGHGQHPAWVKLWRETHDESAAWSLLDAKLAEALPRGRWNQAGIQEISPNALVDDLRRTGCGIRDAGEFSVEERDEVLATIDDQELWIRLPLHTTITGAPVSACGERVYLGAEEGDSDNELAREAILIAPSANPKTRDKQYRWLKPLDDRALIEIALAATMPSSHWRTILDTIGRLGSNIGSDLADMLRTSNWLPTRHGKPVKPEDVIVLAENGGLRDETQRLVAEHRDAHGFCFAVPEDLAKEVRNHSAWGILIKEIFSAQDAGLQRLGLLLEDLPQYHIGTWREAPKEDALKLLAQYPSLPGWRLIRQASDVFNHDNAWKQLGPGLIKKTTPDNLFGVLNWLSDGTGDWNTRKKVFDGYLQQSVEHAAFAKPLANLKLASRSRQWRVPSELCAGVHGVEPDWLLDQNQIEILANLIHRADAYSAPSETQQDAQTAEFENNKRATPGILADDYFRHWEGGLVPSPMIGVVVSLLGRGVRDLANRYLQPHSLEWLLDQLPWIDPGRDAQRIHWMGGNTVTRAVDLIEAAVTVTGEGQVDVQNLLGERIKVPLEQNVQTLLAGELRWKGGYRVQILLRRVEPGSFETDRLSEILRATAERLYADLYNQKNPDFHSLWQELDRSDQLEIGIARRLILDHVPLYLRQLRLNDDDIKSALDQWDQARRRFVEADEAKQDTGSARAKLNERVGQLAGLIEKKPSTQMAVLSGVKGKLEQFEYKTSSIPFELFQNADDAAVELGWIEAHPGEGCDVPEAVRRVVLETGNTSLCFIHWGRPINAQGPSGFDGEQRGFGRDLEKMLVLSSSDKQPENGVTGKFGLGFKSVLLACDRPRIVSGRLAVEVVAGLLPQPWQETQSAREALSNHGDGGRFPGTLVELPELKVPRAEITNRFEDLAGILCVFGKAIRRIDLFGEANKSFSWKPKEISPSIELGWLRLHGDWGAGTEALCVRTNDGDLLLALGPEGFRPLPDKVPALWVTAPMREKTALGFAVNGAFDLDAGRGRLAADNERNRTLAENVGTASGDALSKLLDRTCNDWPSARNDLGLVADLSVHDFWKSIWVGLTQNWHRRSRDSGRAWAGTCARPAQASLRRSSAKDHPFRFGAAVSNPDVQARGPLRTGESLGRPAGAPDLGGLGSFHAQVSRPIPGIRRHRRDTQARRAGTPGPS